MYLNFRFLNHFFELCAKTHTHRNTHTHTHTQIHTHTDTHTHTYTDAHKDSNEYSVVVFFGNATIIILYTSQIMNLPSHLNMF